MKVILVTPLPPPMGGISNWSTIVLNYVNNNCKDIEIKYINISPKKRSTEGRTKFDRVFGGFFSILSTSKKLKKEIKIFKPDVVHICTSGSLALLRDIKILKILKKKKIKSILQLHFGRTPDIIDNNSFEGKLINKAFRLVNTVLAIDQNTMDAVNQKYVDKAVYIPNPFDCSNMPLPRIMDNNNCSHTITYLGWVIKTKGIDELLKAWSNIYQKYPFWRLQIIGPYQDGYYEELKSKYSLEGVTFKGEQKHDDAMKMVNDSDIFVLPSYTEGFPNVILEAMYLGKAIIATNVGAIPEMLENNSGMVIESKSSIMLEETIKKLLEDRQLIIELGINARLRSEIYSVDKIINEYIKIWK